MRVLVVITFILGTVCAILSGILFAYRAQGIFLFWLAALSVAVAVTWSYSLRKLRQVIDTAALASASTSAQSNANSANVRLRSFIFFTRYRYYRIVRAHCTSYRVLFSFGVRTDWLFRFCAWQRLDRFVPGLFDFGCVCWEGVSENIVENTGIIDYGS